MMRRKKEYLGELGIGMLLTTILIFFAEIVLLVFSYFEKDTGHPKPFDLFVITEPMYIGFWIFAPFGLYFFPTLLVLSQREMPLNIKWSVFKKNFLLGWTVIGWLDCWKIIIDRD